MKKFLRVNVVLVLFVLASNVLAGAPYCALRDPSHQIYNMFPAATSYRSVVREVDSQARETLNEEIPFSLHNNELGEHTIYVPLEGSAPLGIVHVRS